MANFIDFSKFCLGPPKFKIVRGPLGPSPVGPWVNASLKLAIKPTFAMNFGGKLPNLTIFANSWKTIHA